MLALAIVQSVDGAHYLTFHKPVFIRQTSTRLYKGSNLAQTHRQYGTNPVQNLSDYSLTRRFGSLCQQLTGARRSAVHSNSLRFCTDQSRIVLCVCAEVTAFVEFVSEVVRMKTGLWKVR